MYGWLHTGDIGLQRQDGNFVLEGRSSEQISVGTVKIFPFDIEKMMVTCPGVDLVMAVPVPDVRLGNAICACVVVKNGSSLDKIGLSEFCDSKWTDGTSLKPKYIILFDHFPTNASGKIDRRALTRQATVLLDL